MVKWRKGRAKWGIQLVRFIAAIASSVILTALLSSLLYTPKDELEHGVYHFGWTELFIINVMYIAPIYLTLGIGVSWTAAQYTRSKFKKLQAYVLSGAGNAGLIAILAMQDDFVLPALLLSILIGTVVALVYWIVEVVLERLFKNKRHVHQARA
ncbi:hypothetical protein [Bhargavaea changchunensis]